MLSSQRISTRRHWITAAVATALSLSLAACTVGPNYKRPSVPVPPAFLGPTVSETTASSTSIGANDWW